MPDWAYFLLTFALVRQINSGMDSTVRLFFIVTTAVFKFNFFNNKLKLASDDIFHLLNLRFTCYMCFHLNIHVLLFKAL